MHMPITNELIAMVDHDSHLKKMLIESIDKAKKINPDRETNPAQTLEEYYAFIDWATKALPWTILEKTPYSSLYDQIDQSVDYFYFINDQPISALKNKGYYNNSIQYYEPYRTWLMLFIKQWGQFLSTKNSWNDGYLNKFFADTKFGLQTGWYEDPSHWKTFNDFFSRHLKSPDQRPIASPNDCSIVVSPADSTPQGVWKIDTSSCIEDGKSIRIKSTIFKSIPQLLGKDSAYKNAFSGGTLTHSFLDIYDYHRFHFPVGGTIKEVRLIKADDAVGGITIWDTKIKKYVLILKNPEWESIETRGCVIIDTGEYGLVALLPVGMSQISSVNFENTVKVGNKVAKGDRLGYFLFGGSDFVMLYEEKAAFALTVPKGSNKKYKHLLMGEKYGAIHPTSDSNQSNRLA